MAKRMPAVLVPRRHAVDTYRDVILRYPFEDMPAARRLANRQQVLDGLTEELRPLLDALVEADECAREVARLRALASGRHGATLSSIARLSLVRAEDRWRIASTRLRGLARDERTLLRYLLLRYLVRR